jgi:hypothetical protein
MRSLTPFIYCPAVTVVLSASVLSHSLAGSAQGAAPTYVNDLTVQNGTDLSGQSGAGNNRLGGIVSDLVFDAANNVYYGLGDRGPGGGLLTYDTRVQKFTLAVDPNTGAVGNFQLQGSILFKTADGSQSFNGQNPGLLSGNKATLGRSFDPEGFALLPNGNYLVSDEYGPSVYEFQPTVVGGTTEARFVRSFAAPANLIPKESGGTINYVDGRPTITTGRQDNRGYEGLTITPDGTKAFAILQDPLVNEGTDNGTADGRRSRNVRIVRYDVASGVSDGQFVYQLEDRSDINARIPGTSDDFSSSNQGRSIGASSIVTLSATKFLVLERDNRGFGVDDPTGSKPVGSKRLYAIDIAGATDVKDISLANTNALPVGVTPVAKSLYLDIQAALVAAGVAVPEKLEGLAFGPQLADGRTSLILGTDNDFSVTQTGAGEQFDVYTDGTGTRFTEIGVTSQSYLTLTDADMGTNGQGPIGGGFALIPNKFYSFATAVPEPGALALLGVASAGLLARGRRRD